jgi:hypothetical protein
MRLLHRLTQGFQRRIWRERMESVERRCISTCGKVEQGNQRAMCDEPPLCVTPNTAEANVVRTSGAPPNKEPATRLTCNLNVPSEIVTFVDLAQTLTFASALKLSLSLART